MCFHGLVHMQETKKNTQKPPPPPKTKMSDTSDKSASALIIYKMFGQVSRGVTVRGLKRRMGRESLGVVTPQRRR